MSDVQVVSVSELTAELKKKLEEGFSRVYVEGEISDWKPYPSGHVYFTLKDAGAVISAVMFKGYYDACVKRHPGIEKCFKNGAKIVVGGKISAYAPHGKYQIIVYGAKVSGEGELMQKYLELKAKLENEGIFAETRKRSLPFAPRHIGVVSSESGAVIHDMCDVLIRRFPNLRITLYPCLVQGETAAKSVVEGLEYFNANPPDLVIVARGGGSFEDLFCFNDENLVRAVASSKAPVISAVGHETDFTLCDFAADRRAGTPSIAAEIAVPVLSEIMARISEVDRGMAVALKSKGEWFAQRLDQFSAELLSSLTLAHSRREKGLQHASQRLNPVMLARLADLTHRLELARQRLEPAAKKRYTDAAHRLSELHAKLALLSPFNVLTRGYSITSDEKGHIIKDCLSVKVGDTIITRLANGEIRSTV